MRPLNILTKTLWAGFTVISAGCLGMSAFFVYLNPQLPDVSEVREVKIKAPLRIYSADNKLIQEFGERLTPITFTDLPPRLVKAVLGIEDKRFFQHSGIDLVTIMNAAWQLVKNRGSIRSGASTIEMQLYKNISGQKEVKFIRKFKEMLMAIKIERELTKQETLALYLNIIPYGKHAHGVQAAANTYYGKNLDALNLAQIAMLAGIAKKPESGNPINGPEWALTRRNLVLKRMLQLSAISSDEYEAAILQPITAREHGRQIEVSGPYLGEMVRSYILEKFGKDAYSQGLTIYTTVDSKMQNGANAVLLQNLEKYDIRHGYRGPESTQASRLEASLAAAAIQADSDATATTTATTTNAPEEVDSPIETGTESAYPQDWLTALDKASVAADKYPAVVIEVKEKEINVLTKDQSVISIGWEGLKWARAHLTVDSLGPAPKKAKDIVNPGDLVRIVQREIISDEEDKKESEKPKESGNEELENAVEEEQLPWVLSQVTEIQGALVALDPNNGAIKALVGGNNFYKNQFNHVTQARRQPGSNFKPFVYVGALEDGMTPASIFNDAALILPGGDLEEMFRPINSNKKFRGEVRLRQALYLSMNLVSMRVLLQFGAGKAINYVERFGFDTSNFPRNTQLAVGGGTIALTPLEVATGYAAFANGGYKVEPYLIQAVESIKGDMLYTAKPPTVCRDCLEQAENEIYLDEIQTPSAPRIIEERAAYLMDTILSDVVRRGTGTKAIKALNRRDLRGKTGTTNDATDIWFSGYTRDLVATVWAGFDDNTKLGRYEWGATVPLDTWIEFARLALPDESETTVLPQPDGLVTIRINSKTGERASPSDPDAIFETFREEYVPEPLTEFTQQKQETVDSSSIF